MGKTRFTVYLKCGSMEVRDVDYCTGWDYCGEYLVLQESRNGMAVYHPYNLRDVDYFTRESIETVH